jgi:hypothetical protein
VVQKFSFRYYLISCIVPDDGSSLLQQGCGQEDQVKVSGIVVNYEFFEVAKVAGKNP